MGRRGEGEVTLNSDPVDRNRRSNAEVDKNSRIKNLRERERERGICDVAVGQRIQISLHVYRTVALTNRIFTIPELGDVCECAADECAREKEKKKERERERVKRGWKCWSGREKRGGMTETALDIEGTGGGYRRHVHLHRFAWKQPFSMSRHRIYLSLDRRWFLRHFVSSFHVSIETRLSNRVSRLLSIDYHSFPCVHNSMKTEKEKVRNNNKNSNNNKYTFLENNNFLQRDKWKIIISSQS